MGLTSLSGATVVITGASSGIGRAASVSFARSGAKVVLAARGLESLQEVARECHAAGGTAQIVETDTTDAAAMQALAEAAEAFGGRIDVWVNNAGVAAFGPFLDTPIEAHDQVIRTNLMGYLYGAHAVLPVFKRQGGGVLINVISMAGWSPTPLAASYSASKHGARGLAETLRVELAGSDPNIHVCDVHPAFVDTPMLEHTANYSGRRLKPVPPVIPVERVAQTIVELALRPRASTPMGIAFPFTVAFQKGLPSVFRRLVGQAAQLYLRLAPSVPRTEAGLFKSSAASHAASGGLRSPSLRLLAGGGALAVALLGASLLIRSRVAGSRGKR